MTLTKSGRNLYKCERIAIAWLVRDRSISVLAQHTFLVEVRSSGARANRSSQM